MCQSTAYVKKGNMEELVMEEVDTLEVLDGKKVKLSNIFGETKTVEGRVKQLSLVNHRIIIESLG